MSVSDFPSSSQDSGDAAGAARSISTLDTEGSGSRAVRTVEETSHGSEEVDIPLGDASEGTGSDVVQSAVSSIKSHPPPAATSSPPPARSRELPSTPPKAAASSDDSSSAKRQQPAKQERGNTTRGVELSSDEERKLADVRRKLKDIFATAEKAAPPKEETIKAGDQQTVTSGLLDLRTLAKDLLSKEGHDSQRVDNDMLLLNGGLFDGPRGGSLVPPDFSSLRSGQPIAKPPPPVRPPQPAPTEDVEEVEVETEADVKPALHARPFLGLNLKADRKLQALPQPRVQAVDLTDPDLDDLPPLKGPMSGRTLTAITIAFTVLLGSVFFVMMRSGGDETTPDTSRKGSEEADPSRTSSEPRLGEPSRTGGEPHEAQPSAAVSPERKDPKSASTTKVKAESTSAPGKGTSKGASGGSEAPTAATTAPKGNTQSTAATPPSEPTKAPAPPPPPQGDEFDRSAASSALNAAASRAMGCKGDGPSGSASVSVTFAPSGRVTSARVDGPPFSGTPTGGCIATAFRSATVPPFGGSPVTVRKTVSIR